MKRRADVILDAVTRAAGVTRVYEVGSERHQQREGFTVAEGIVRGEGAPTLSFTEGGVRFSVAAPGSAGGGQKTGYYFDQRENRAAVASLASGARALDAFSYVGGFGLAAAAKAGAREVVCVDSSASALAVGQRIAEATASPTAWRTRRAMFRDVLGQLGRAGERFDVVVIDPPSSPTAPARSRRRWPTTAASTPAPPSSCATAACS